MNQVELLKLVLSSDISLMAISLALVTFLPALFEFGRSKGVRFLASISIKNRLKSSLVKLCFINCAFVLSMILSLWCMIKLTPPVFWLAVISCIAGVLGLTVITLQLAIQLIKLMDN